MNDITVNIVTHIVCCLHRLFYVTRVVHICLKCQTWFFTWLLYNLARYGKLLEKNFWVLQLNSSTKFGPLRVLYAFVTGVSRGFELCIFLTINFLQIFSLLTVSLWIPKFFRAFSYDWYSDPKMATRADFCTLSIWVLCSIVIPELHKGTANSRIDLSSLGHTGG